MGCVTSRADRSARLSTRSDSKRSVGGKANMEGRQGDAAADIPAAVKMHIENVTVEAGEMSGNGGRDLGGRGGALEGAKPPATKMTPDDAEGSGQRAPSVTHGRMVLKDGGDGDFYEHYEMLGTLGKGSFGVVAECVERRTGTRRAVKAIRKGAMMHRKDILNLRREIEVMRHLRTHRNVVQIFGAYEDDHNVFIVLELCEGGDMFRKLLKIEKYTEQDAAGICREALKALSHIHSRGVVYRDLKPDNFLFDMSDLTVASLKAADFGLSSFIQPDQYLTSTCGTPMYCAPEVIRKRYHRKADIWSLGVTLYIMLSGKVPFWGRSMQETLTRVMQGTFHFKDEAWQTVTPSAIDCVKQMLIYDVDQRPDADQLLQHPWIVVNGMAAAVPLLDSVYENLLHFSDMNKLQKRAVQIMATKLKLEDIKAVRKAFKELDRDQSGCLSVGEMRHALGRANLFMSDEQLNELWATYDVDGDGMINYVEFLTATTTLNKILTVENMQHAFEEMDVDGNGALSAQEIRDKLDDLHLGDTELDGMIQEADTNGDGVIDYAEFVTMMANRNRPVDSEQSLMNMDSGDRERYLTQLLTWCNDGTQ